MNSSVFVASSTSVSLSFICSTVWTYDQALLLDSIRVVSGVPATVSNLVLAKTNFPYSFELPILTTASAYSFNTPLAGSFPTYPNPIVFGGLSGIALAGAR